MTMIKLPTSIKYKVIGSSEIITFRATRNAKIVGDEIASTGSISYTLIT